MTRLEPGFASPLAAQACFRALLTAFGTPGRIVALPCVVEPPAGLSPAAAAVLLTLADPATGVALPAQAAARDWLAFHTGAPRAAPADAAFCVAAERPDLASLRQGSEEVPEDGATLILDVPALDAGRRCRLAGPGLAAPVMVDLPVDGAFVSEWRAQMRRAPCGIDVLLCAGHRVMALPRSLSIEEI